MTHFRVLTVCILHFVGIVAYTQVPSHTQTPDKGELTQKDQEWLNRLKNKSPFILPSSVKLKQISTKDKDKTIMQGNPAAGLGDDADADGLNGSEELALKTDPMNPDSDGDGLWDGWEVNITNGIDLRAMGASPLHKDIFVEMDFMNRESASNGLGPNANVIQQIEFAFAKMPISNPDNVTGINIHLVAGNIVSYDEDLSPYNTEFFRIKASNFDPNRAPFFHYMIWANGYSGGLSSGISLNIPHSDFIVTLGKWNNRAGGTDEEKIGTFIHELGHNLGLMHGGNEHINFKPNHLSVMNYFFQTQGIRFRTVDNVDQFLYTYQRFPLPRLIESSLREEAGIGRGAVLQGFFTTFRSLGGGIHEYPAHSAIDWNFSGVIDRENVQVDINSNGTITELQATPNECLQLVFDGGAIGKLGSLAGILDDAVKSFEPLPIVELTEELNSQLKVR